MVSIATASESICVLTANRFGVTCFGKAASGQLGKLFEENDNVTLIKAAESVDVPLPQGVAILVAGNEFYCALLLDRVTIYCWGQNVHGQLGFVNGSSNANAYTFLSEMAPQPIAKQNIKFVRDLSAGSNHVCAVVDVDDAQTGRVMCWGDNSMGQLGDVARPSTVHPQFLKDPTSVCINATRLAPMIPPTPVPGPPTPTTLSTPEPTLEPTPVPGAATPQPTPYPTIQYCEPKRLLWAFESQFPTFLLGERGEQAARVFAGATHTCAVTVNGAVYCWGNNLAHQLGHANVHVGSGRRTLIGANETVPIALADNKLGDVFDVSLSSSSTCVLSYNGFVKCFGARTLGELGEDSNAVIGEPLLQAARNGDDIFSRTITNTSGSQISVDGSGYAHHLVGGWAGHCFTSKYKSVVCWGEPFIRMFRGLVSVKPASTIAFAPGDNEPIVLLARPRSSLLFAAVTASGKLRLFGNRPYFDAGLLNESRIAVNNESAVVPLKRDVTLATSEPECKNGRFGRDCSCTAPVPHFATCFKDLPTLRTPVERSETLRIDRPLQLHHQQPIEGTVQFDLPKAFVEKDADLPVLTSVNGECKSVMEATFIISMDVDDIKRLALVDIIRGCEPPGADSAVYRLDVRNFTAFDSCSNYTLEREMVPDAKGVSVRVKRAPCIAAATESNTVAIVVITLLIVAILLLAIGFFLRRYLRRARSSAGSDTVRPSSSSSPTDALSSGGRQSITSSADSGGLTAGHYARVSLGDDPTDVNVHAYDRVALGSQTSNEYARAPAVNDYEKPTSRLGAKSDYDAATSPLEPGDSESRSDPDGVPEQYQKMPHAPRERAETEL